ncbi:FtsX-like permease family protein [Thomasclavelia spiroformis]|uniref:ABC transporter permease n=1 Tax=Thomasclavelia spiroformis TaxID=29348 RepID=UPI0029427952|nr:FtsX-like permease family protein [Thomasclavelia spiroformis]
MVSVLGIVILMLIMTLRIRGRIKEAGILLSIGRSKKEIVGQFVIEAVFLLLMGFLLAVIIFIPVSSMLNTHLFATVMQETIKDIQLTTRNTNYLQLDIYKTILLLGTETGMTALTVIVSSAMVLSLKPKEILTKMS